MADLTPAELAKLDQIHSAVMDRLTALVSSAVDGIRTEGEPFTASSLAGQAQATDHTSVSTLFAAALIRLARHQIADEKRAALRQLADDTPMQPAVIESITSELGTKPEATP